MNFQQTRRIKLPKLAILLILFTGFCTFTLYSPFSQKESSETETSIDNLQDPIRTTELLKQSDSSHLENFNDSSSSDNAEDAAAYNSSLSEDIKSMEEDNVQQFTSPDWPDITVEDLLKKDAKKEEAKKKEEPEKKGQVTKKKEVSQNTTDSKNESSKFDSRVEKRPSNKSGMGTSKNEYRKQDHQFPSALVSSVEEKESCDIFSGEWVPNPEAPYYTNRTCKHIQEHQNCMKFGKPDKGYMKWRWKPDNGCELPLFDPQQFLELLRGKSLAFVGDSVARNHMQSLLCLLSTAVVPKDISINKDQNFRRFQFPGYNFTISIFWAPYLVRTQRTDLKDETRPFKLFLDEPDEYWPSQVKSYDYILLSAGQWFFRPAMFYLNRTLVGCLYCHDKNVTQIASTFGYRRAFRTALSAINNLKQFKGVTFFRTFATSHFEGGAWDEGGDCVRTKPLQRNESAIEDYSLQLYKIQLEELRSAQKGARKGLKFKLFDATRPMSLRPDGHPSKYGHSPKQKVQLANDCVHWCLPGPIDTLNDFLQELITRES